MEEMKQKLAVLEERVDTTQAALVEIKDDIKDIKDNLLKRPSWAVSVIITVLCSICAGLVIAILR